MTLCFTDECRKTRAEKKRLAAAELAKKEAACSELPALKSKVENALPGAAKRQHMFNACKKAKECGSPEAKEVLEKFNGKDGNFGECTVGGRKKKRKSRRKKKTKKRRKTKRKSRRRKSRKTKRRRRKSRR